MDSNQPVASAPQERVIVKEKMKSRPAVVVLSVLLILALAGAGLLGAIAYSQTQTLNGANDEIAKLFMENVRLKNASTGGGKDFVDESAINRASQDYLRANNIGLDKVIVNIRYIDPNYEYARVIVNENLGKNNGVITQGITIHTFVLKSLANDDQDKSWVIVAVDANSPSEQKAVQEKYDIPADVFTKSTQQQ